MDFVIIEATLNIFKPNLCVFYVMGGYVLAGGACVLKKCS